MKQYLEKGGEITEEIHAIIGTNSVHKMNKAFYHSFKNLNDKKKCFETKSKDTILNAKKEWSIVYHVLELY